MPRSYQHISNYGKEILEMKAQGLTRKWKRVNAVFSLANRKEVKSSVKYQVIFKHKEKVKYYRQKIKGAKMFPNRIPKMQHKSAFI